MSVLDVPGARLYYETSGSGPLLLLIPGGGGTAHAYGRLTPQLAAHYTVLTYDRRGFSRSQLDGPQDYEHRLEADADDVRRLIEHVGDQPATVFGNSSGAIVALEVLTLHPTVVGTLVAHEPPAIKLLVDRQQWLEFFFTVYDSYRKAGPAPALQLFGERALPASDRQALAQAPPSADGPANAAYWFEHELRQYPAVDLDVAALQAVAERIVPMAGRESKGFLTYAVTAELARSLGQELVELPGGHIGFLTEPAGFAQELVQALVRTASYPQKE